MKFLQIIKLKLTQAMLSQQLINLLIQLIQLIKYLLVTRLKIILIPLGRFIGQIRQLLQIKVMKYLKITNHLEIKVIISQLLMQHKMKLRIIQFQLQITLQTRLINLT